MIDEGLMKKEIDLLNELYPTCIELCDILSEYKIPESIGHGDFHDNNMLIDKTTGAINIIDWGEAVIIHPFFSLQSCLWSTTYFYSVNETDLIYSELQSKCMANWLNIQKESVLLKALNVAAKLNGIYAALSFARLYTATEDYPRNLRQEKRGSIAGCLRSFINRNQKSG